VSGERSKTITGVIENDHAWVRMGRWVEYVFGERRAPEDDHWAGYRCLYCDHVFVAGEWIWNVPDDWVPDCYWEPASRYWPDREAELWACLVRDFAWCTPCMRLFRVRPREVPREFWLSIVHGWLPESLSWLAAKLPPAPEPDYRPGPPDHEYHLREPEPGYVSIHRIRPLPGSRKGTA
jgi:hypothetical protein